MKKSKTSVPKPHVADKHSQQKSPSQKRANKSLPHQILDLQQVIGNQAVQRFVTNHEQNQITVHEFSTSLPTIFRVDEEKKTELQDTFKYPYNSFSLDDIEEVSGSDGINILYKLLVTDLKLGYGDRFRKIWPSELEEALSDTETRGDRTEEKWKEGVKEVYKWHLQYEVRNSSLLVDYLKDPSLLPEPGIPSWGEPKDEDKETVEELRSKYGLGEGGETPTDGKKLDASLSEKELLALSEYYQKEFGMFVFEDETLLFAGTWAQTSLPADDSWRENKTLVKMTHAHPGEGKASGEPSYDDLVVYMDLTEEGSSAILKIIYRDGDAYGENKLDYKKVFDLKGVYDDYLDGVGNEDEFNID